MTFTQFLKLLWKKYNPFDLNSVIEKTIHRFDEMEEKIDKLHYTIAKDIAILENELAEKELVLQQFVDVIPDMVWFKDMSGKYVYANQSIRDQLLLCPNPIGQDDVTLAKKAKEYYGEDNHTFGEKCANSDIITIENYNKGQISSRFLEHGKVKGKMMYLEVHKRVVVDKFGHLLGVCGSGRILTEYIEAVKAIEGINCENGCCIEIQKLTDIFKKYEFGGE